MLCCHPPTSPVPTQSCKEASNSKWAMRSEAKCPGEDRDIPVSDQRALGMGMLPSQHSVLQRASQLSCVLGKTASGRSSQDLFRPAGGSDCLIFAESVVDLAVSLQTSRKAKMGNP